MGSSTSLSVNASSVATIAAFAFSTSKMVSIRMISTPPSMSAITCSKYESLISSNVIVLEDGSSTFSEEDNVRFVGPTAPATNRILPSSWVISSAACLAISAACRFISFAESLNPYSSCATLVALNVFVSMMSLPAARYDLCISKMMSGEVRFKTSLFPF